MAAEPIPTETFSYDDDPAFPLHRGGKLEMRSTIPVRNKDDLSLAYTPGVARVCTAIADHPELAYDYTWTSKVVAVVTDGTAVLGLGDIGPAASMPVMEGKSLLFKEFAGVDSVPIALSTTDVDSTPPFTYTLVSGTGATDNASFTITNNQHSFVAISG